MRPKKGDLTRPRVKSKKDPKDSILLGNNKASQILDADAKYRRAEDLLRAEPLLSRNELFEKLRSVGVYMGNNLVGRIYQEHRKNMSRS